MIHLFTGTKAQVIKMAPVAVELRERGIAFRTVDSGQHADLTRPLRRVFGLGEPDVRLRSAGGDVVSLRGAVKWYAGQTWQSIVHGRWLRDEVFPGGGICLIHGDTLTTMLGMRMAKRAGLEVAHVEAGLRSFCAWEPFPEELIRVRCMRRADVLFAPSDEAVGNLQRMNVRGRVVNVGGNTVADALRLVDGAPTPASIPDGPFALATCHRVENIRRKSRLTRIVALLNRVSERMRVVFVVHKPTLDALRRFGLAGALSSGVERLGMLDYPDMVAMLKAARVVLTDGGSIQEECACLGKPCLILRRATERPDGLGMTAMLWAFDDAAGDAFVSRADAIAAPPSELPRPSVRIVDTLVEMGYAG